VMMARKSPAVINCLECGIHKVYEKKIKELEAKNTRLKKALIDIEKRCDYIDNDRRESDKVLCGTSGIKFVIAQTYPKCER
jgi:hypothetical protein